MEQIKNWNFPALELLFVDDGSTDRSRAIAHKYSVEYSWIQLYCQPNSGPGIARNKGLEEAKGKYILFLDADDDYSSDMPHVLKAKLDDNSVDITMFGYVENNLQALYRFKAKLKNGIYRSNDEIRDMYASYLINLNFGNGYVWNKVYRRDFLIGNNIRFGSERIQEDEIFNLRSLRKAESLLLLSDTLYIYNIYGNNSTFRFNPQRFDNLMRMCQEIIDLTEYWSRTSQEVANFINRRIIDSTLISLEELFNPRCTLSNDNVGIKVETILQDPLVKRGIDSLTDYDIATNVKYRLLKGADMATLRNYVRKKYYINRWLQPLKMLLRRISIT